MEEIDLALAESIGICLMPSPDTRELEVDDSTEEDPSEDEEGDGVETFVKIKTERDIYRVMCEKLIDKIIRARVDVTMC